MFFCNERHLAYPLTAEEKIAVRAAPPDYMNQLPVYYAFGDLFFNRELVDRLAELAEEDPSEPVFNEHLLEGGLGNALDLTGALYDRWFQGGPLPDFNLDGDRGYGYLCWSQIGDAVNTPTILITNLNAADPTEVRLRFIP